MTPKLPPSQYFPSAEVADEDGLVCYGGDLSVELVLDAYRHGIFPWPVAGDEMPMLWWSLDPRGVLPLENFHVPGRLQRTIRSGRFEVTRNRAFAEVMDGCATAPGRVGVEWLTEEMREAYLRLHRLGHAHSVEVWCEGQVVGGVYGVAIGGLFAGESMFYRKRDASKVALVALVTHLRDRGFVLLDIQQANPHVVQFGAIEIPQSEYLDRLAEALEVEAHFE